MRVAHIPGPANRVADKSTVGGACTHALAALVDMVLNRRWVQI